MLTWRRSFRPRYLRAHARKRLGEGYGMSASDNRHSVADNLGMLKRLPEAPSADGGVRRRLLVASLNHGGR